MKKVIAFIFLLTILFANAAEICRFTFEAPDALVSSETARNIEYDAVLLDNAEYVDAVEGKGVRVTGLGEGIRVKLPELPDAICFSMYLHTENHSTNMVPFCFYRNDENFIELFMSGKQLVLRERTNDKSKDYPVDVALDDDRFHHFALEFNGIKRRFFIDGKMALAYDGELTLPQLQTKMLLLGCDYHSAVDHRYRYVGVMDEARLGDLPEDHFAREAKKASIAKLPSEPSLPVFAGEGVRSARVNPKTQSFVFDGNEEPFVMYAGGGFLAGGIYALESAADASSAGIDVFRATPCGGREFCGGLWWIDDDTYDFSMIERNLAIVFRQNPKAKIMLSIAISPPAWWGEKHPDEITQDFNGSRHQDYFASHSYASEKWLQDAEKAYDAFFKYLKTTPYWDRIIGFFMVSGRYGECLRSNYNSQLYKKEYTDYCPAETNGFRGWLRKHYGSAAEMNTRWGQPVDLNAFDSVSVPTPTEWQKSALSYFMDPVAGRKCIDYMRFINDSSAESVCRYTSFIRQMAGPDKVIGLYYGYVREDAGGFNRAWISDSGHLGLEKVLAEAPVDFLMSPVGYTQREIGKVGPCMGAPASVAMHGKLYAYEADIRTSLTGHRAEYSGAADLEESLAILWRTFGNCVVERAGYWWFPIAGRPSYSHPRIWEAFRKMRDEMTLTAKIAPADDRSRRVAIIVDPMSYHFRHHTFMDNVANNLVTLSRDVFAKSAIGEDTYIIDDIETIPDDYPVYVFVNSYFMTDAQRETVNRRLKKDGKLLVWTYGSGYFGATDLDAAYHASADNITALTGVNVEKCEGSVKASSAPQKDAPDGLSPLSLNASLEPFFVVNDAEAQIWETIDGDAVYAGRPAVAFKQMDGWRSLYIGVPEFTTSLVRSIAKIGDAHVWSDAEDVVIRHGNGHILIHSGHEDSVNLFLDDGITSLVDVATGEKIRIENGRAVVEIGRNRTILLRVDN